MDGSTACRGAEVNRPGTLVRAEHFSFIRQASPGENAMAIRLQQMHPALVHLPVALLPLVRNAGVSGSAGQPATHERLSAVGAGTSLA